MLVPQMPLDKYGISIFTYNSYHEIWYLPNNELETTKQFIAHNIKINTYMQSSYGLPDITTDWGV